MDHNRVRGRLTYSVGESLLSAWEAGRLAPGDIVLTTRLAGSPGLVLFNNLPLGTASVVVLDDTLMLRLDHEGARFDVDPGRGGLGDLVPVVVELGSFEIDLDELQGLGRQSIVNLSVPLGPGNAVLRYGGVALARGTVVVVGEVMALKIDERLLATSPLARVSPSGNVADPITAATAKVYDFCRPDHFSVVQIRRLDEIHRLFQRHLESAVPEWAARLGGHTEALLVDQCTLGEARALLAERGLSSLVTWDHEGGRLVAALNPRYYEPADASRPLGESTRRWLTEAFAAGPSVHRPLFVFAKQSWSAEVIAVISDALRSGWRRFVDLPVGRPLTGDAGLADSDMVILVALRSAPSAPWELAVVYPAVFLEPYLSLLGS